MTDEFSRLTVIIVNGPSPVDEKIRGCVSPTSIAWYFLSFSCNFSLQSPVDSFFFNFINGGRMTSCRAV